MMFAPSLLTIRARVLSVYPIQYAMEVNLNLTAQSAADDFRGAQWGGEQASPSEGG